MNIKGTIEWLTSLLQTELKEADLNSIYSDVFNNFEQKTIPELTKEIKNIKDISLFKVFFEKKKKSLNKISFVLWASGEIEKLPNPSNPAEFDIWSFEVLPSFDWKTLQQVLTKLYSEQGASKQVEQSYKYLISPGWDINSKKDLEAILYFLIHLKLFFLLFQ